MQPSQNQIAHSISTQGAANSNSADQHQQTFGSRMPVIDNLAQNQKHELSGNEQVLRTKHHLTYQKQQVMQNQFQANFQQQQHTNQLQQKSQHVVLGGGHQTQIGATSGRLFIGQKQPIQLRDDQSKNQQARVPSAGAQRNNQKVAQIGQVIKQKTKIKKHKDEQDKLKNKTNNADIGYFQSNNIANNSNFVIVQQHNLSHNQQIQQHQVSQNATDKMLLQDMSCDGSQPYQINQQHLLDASNLSMHAIADDLQQLLAHQQSQNQNFMIAHPDASYILRDQLSSADPTLQSRILTMDGRQSAKNLNDEDGTASGSLERVAKGDADSKGRKFILQDGSTAIVSQNPIFNQQKVPKRSNKSNGGGHNQSNSKVNSQNKAKENQLFNAENNKDQSLQAMISWHDRSALAANLSSTCSHHEQLDQQHQQLILKTTGKLQKITTKISTQGSTTDGKKDTSRVKGLREASVPKQNRDANGVDRPIQSEGNQNVATIPPKKSKSQSNQSTIIVPSQQQSNRRKVSELQGNQKKQYQLVNHRGQQLFVMQGWQQHLENPQLIQQIEPAERSPDENTQVIFPQAQELTTSSQTQLMIKCGNNGAKAPISQQLPTSKASTKYGGQRATNTQSFKMNEFGCLIGTGGGAATGKNQMQNQSQGKGQLELQVSLDQSHFTHDQPLKKQQIIQAKGHYMNSTTKNVSNNQLVGKKGQLSQPRVQSGYPVIKSSKVNKRAQIQMTGSTQQNGMQKMNQKQANQTATGNGNCVYMVLKQPSGKDTKSGQLSRGHHQVPTQLNAQFFNQTGKLVSSEVKAEATGYGKAKFNRTHGYQDNQFIIQSLKQDANLSPSVAKTALVDGSLEGSALEQRNDASRNQVVHSTVSEAIMAARRGNTGLASQPGAKNETVAGAKNDQMLIFPGGAARMAGRAGRSLGLQPSKGSKRTQLGKQGVSSTEAGNFNNPMCSSHEYFDPGTVLSINRLDFAGADPHRLRLGPTGLDGAGLRAPGPGALFAQAHGPSSATNKVKKAFEFEIEAQQQMMSNMREKKTLLAAGSAHQSNANQTADSINAGGRKAASTNKKVSNLIKMQAQNAAASGPGTKKVNLQKPKTFIKTQMNLTGPLPKHMLSPGPYTNKSKLKAKHSQYFDNSSEVENHGAAQSNKISQAQDYATEQQKLARNYNTSQHFQQAALMPHEAASGATTGPNAPSQPHQFQVQVHGIGQDGAPIPRAQHQITTQGGSTVININIDSNGWGQPSIRQTSYQTQQQQQLMAGTDPAPSDVVMRDAGAIANINLAPDGQHVALQGAHPRQSHVSYLSQPPFAHPDVAQGQGLVPMTQPLNLQTNSKLRQNESVSSNKSRRHGQGSNNRRSNSSSHAQNQIAHAVQYPHQQNHQQYMTAAGQGSNYGELPASHYNFQSVPATAVHPHSNTQIISQNIAKINEKLLQQQHQQNLLVAEHSRDSNHQVGKEQEEQNLSCRADQLNNSKVIAPQHTSFNLNNQTQIIKSSDFSRIDLQNQKNLVYQSQQKKNSTTLVMNQLQLGAQGKQTTGGNPRSSNMKLLSQTQLVTAALSQANRHDLQIQHQPQSHPFPSQALSVGNGGASASGPAPATKQPSLQVLTFQVIPKKSIKQGASQGVGTPNQAKQSQKQLRVAAAGPVLQPAALSDYASGTKRQPSGSRATATQAIGTSVAQPSKLAMKKVQAAHGNKKGQIVLLTNGPQINESTSQISSARFQSTVAPATAQLQRWANQQGVVKKSSVSMTGEAAVLLRQMASNQPPEDHADETRYQLAMQAQEQQVASMGNLQTVSKSNKASYDQQAEYDRHVRNLENQIQLDQIRLRNELAQMRKVQDSSKQPRQHDDQMDEMQMDVDNEDIGNSLDGQVLTKLDQQAQLQKPCEDGQAEGLHYIVNGAAPAEAQFAAATSAGGNNSGLHQYNQIRQQAALVSLENSQIQYLTSFNNSMGGGAMSAAVNKAFKTNASSSQKTRQFQTHQSLTAVTGTNSAAMPPHTGHGYPNNRNATQSGSVQRRQPSHEEQTKIQMIEDSGRQSIRQGSQLRVSQHQMANQSSASRAATSNQGGAGHSKSKGNNNRSTAISFKGSNMSNRSRSKAGRGSKFNQRVSTGKYNFEHINIDVEARHQLLMDSSLGLAAAVQSFGTKKSVTTKNQNLSNKLHTQNVQSLLREAKREMLCDGTDFDQIYVGGDDVTLKNTKKKRINFNGSQNLALGPQINNFGFQQQRQNIKYGVSPKSNSKKLELPSHASIMLYNMISANTNAKSSPKNNVSNLQMSDQPAYNNGVSQVPQPQVQQAQRSSLKQAAVPVQDGGSVLSRKQMLKHQSAVQQSASTAGQSYQNGRAELQGNDQVASVQQKQPSPPLQKSDVLMLQATDANSGTSSGQLGQSRAGAVVRHTYAASTANQTATDGANAFVQQQPQYSSQISTAIMKGGAAALQSQGVAATTGAKAGANTGTHTFGLGQLNYLGNKVIKPSLAPKTTTSGTEDNQSPLYGRNEQVEWENSNQNGYQTQYMSEQQEQQLHQVQNLQQEDDSRHFKDSNMDMDKANEENEQLNHININPEAIQPDMDSQDPVQLQGDSELQVVADSPYGNNTAAGNGVNADWQIINQSHAFSLAQDPSQLGSGAARPTTMHSLQLVDLTEMTEDMIEEQMQPQQQEQFAQFAENEVAQSYEIPDKQKYHLENVYEQQQQQIQMVDESQAQASSADQQQFNKQQIHHESQVMLKSLQEETQRNPKASLEAEQPDLPLSGAKVLKHYLKRPGLTEYEKSEILDYKACFFLGIGAEKIKGSKHHQFNSGYDDERGDYNVILKDHIAYRFEVLDFLGKGSFGQALKCVDHKTNEIVAIKIIRNKKKFQHQAGVELKILLHLKENDPEDTNNIIRIKDYCMFRKHLIISFELFSINLYEFIRNNNFEGVSLSLIRRFAIQILQALKYLREESLIHCDLKPENILLKSPDKSGIKVIDFGSSCFAHERIYTYIQSRFYRAPEIILGIPYTTAIDMWSFGCILTELFTGVPLFPGESEQEQLSLIMEVIGLPPADILAQASRKTVFFDEATNEPYLSRDSQGNLRVPSSKPLDEVLMCQSDSFHDFITKCLEWDPEKRITPFEALMHEWIIEGLPDQVLIHHKKMLGIYESETEGGNTGLNNRSLSIFDTSVQDADNTADVSGLQAAGSVVSQNPAHSASNAADPSLAQSLAGSPSKQSQRQLLLQQQNQVMLPSARHQASNGFPMANSDQLLLDYNDHEIANNAAQQLPLEDSAGGCEQYEEDGLEQNDVQAQRIDFYRHQKAGAEQAETFEDERYESVDVAQGNQLDKQLHQNSDDQYDLSKNLMAAGDDEQIDLEMLLNGYQMQGGGGGQGANNRGKEISRSGAKQENFTKTFIY